MKQFVLTAIGLSIIATTSVLADSPTTAQPPAMSGKAAKAIKPTTLTCEEFLSYDDVTRPQIVYWSEGLNRQGKPEDAVIDVDRTNRLVPVLIEDCTKEPSASYWTKMKQEFKKIF
jgi:acid stress chaperone HdeA